MLTYKKDALENLSPDLNEDLLDLELYKISQAMDLELRQKQEEFLQADPDDLIEREDYQQKYKDFLNQLNDVGKSNLAKYVAHRKVILSLLENGLKKIPDTEKYNKEDFIHQLICPMHVTSEDTSFSQQNLWVIDERLAYHYYLASDIPLSQQTEVCNVDSLDRPDILIYNKALAFVENGRPFNSIVVIEFKRPCRKQYDETDDNPISQVYRYIEQIRAGDRTDKEGRPITAKDIPFYAYVICDITKKIIQFAKLSSLAPTPDGEGYFGYSQPYQCYIEIISYNKLINDANKRNQILFDRLFSPRQNF